MTRRPSGLGWLPPFLVGAAAAIAAEVAIGMLLYSGPGFMRSLTVILAVEGSAFACGLWSAPSVAPDIVERLRRRWLLCLSTFLLAAIYGTTWSVVLGLGADALAQGLGLAILAGLPLYSAGAVLGGLSVAANTDPGGRLRGPGAAAAAGAALGFVLTGFLLPRAPMPASLLIGCLVMLSLGGMVFGSVLGTRLDIHVRARRPSGRDEVRVEDHRLSKDKVASRLLFEGPHVRRELSLSDSSTIPWDSAVVRALMPGPEAEWRVLMVGGGASTAPRTVLREHPLGEVDVLERTDAVIELGREHFDTELSPTRDDRVHVHVGHLDDLLGSLESAYDVVIVDTRALAPVGGVLGLSSLALERLYEGVKEGGTIAWGPRMAEEGSPAVAEGSVQSHFLREATGKEERIVLTGDATTSSWADAFDGFRGEMMGRAPSP